MLVGSGALIPIEVGMRASDAALHGIRTGRPTVTVEILASIDTGATVTSIDRSVLANFDLEPGRFVTVSTPVGIQRFDAYPLRLAIPSLEFAVEIPRVPAIDLSGSAAQRAGRDRPILALLGRDVLRFCTFSYHGAEGRFTLTLEDS